MQNFKNNLRSQKGISLLLAILVLASIMAISFSLATILFVEINTSGQLVRSNTAFYATFAQTEDSIFRTRRGVSGTSPQSTTIGTVAVTTQTSSTSSPVQVVKIKAGTCNYYDLINPTSAYSGGNGYARYVITYLGPSGGGYLKIYQLQFDPSSAGSSTGSTTCPPTPESQYLVATISSYNTTYPGSTSLNSWNINPNYQYQVVLYNQNSVDMYAQIETDVPDPSDPTNQSKFIPSGLPAFDQSIIQVNGTQSDVTRHVEVVVPKK